MSRYVIPAKNPVYQGIVGWDNPLQTFFAQVFDPTLPEDRDEIIFWVGDSSFQDIPTVTVLQERLAPYASIPGETLIQLTRDYEQRTAPTNLQQEMLALRAARLGWPFYPKER